MDPLKMYFLLNMVIFRCHVSLLEGNILVLLNSHPGQAGSRYRPPGSEFGDAGRNRCGPHHLACTMCFPTLFETVILLETHRNSNKSQLNLGFQSYLKDIYIYLPCSPLNCNQFLYPKVRYDWIYISIRAFQWLHSRIIGQQSGPKAKTLMEIWILVV